MFSEEVPFRLLHLSRNAKKVGGYVRSGGRAFQAKNEQNLTWAEADHAIKQEEVEMKDSDWG